MNKVYPADSAIDADVIAGVYKLCFREPLNGDSIWKTVCNQTSFAFLGRESRDTEPAGFIICRVIAEESELLWLGVRPEKQRQGWARFLMLKAAEEARSRGAQTMVLEVAENNMPARHLYGNLGFKIVGYRPTYYKPASGGVSDARIMSVTLGALCTKINLSY